MGLRIEIDQMITETGFRRGVRRALARALVDINGETLARDLLLVPQREYDKPGMAELIDELSPEIGNPSDVRPFPIDKRWDAALHGAVAR